MSELKKLKVGTLTDAVIFDLDGTLLNSFDEVMLCLAEAFELEGYEIDKSRMTPNVIGPPLNIIAKSILPTISDEGAGRVVDRYNEIYDSEKYAISKLYPHIYDLLVMLKEAGKRLFIATNKPKISTIRLLKKYNLSMFEDVYVIDKYEGRIITKKEMIRELVEKYNLNKQKTVMIGDALGDITAAQANDIKAIAALWGYGDDKQPLLDTADMVAKNALELMQFL